MRLLVIEPTERWDAATVCAQTDPEVFFPEKGDSTREAKRICSGCDVRAQCLEYAMAADERFGIFGGLSVRERRRPDPRCSMIPELTTDEVQRFYAQLLVRDGEGCWLWTGETNNRGYGRFTIYRGGRRVRILAHRLAYKLATGSEADGVVRHTCDNPPCCRPADLLSGTQSQNMRDAVIRGRADVSGLEAHREQRDQAAESLRKSGQKKCSTCQTVKRHDAFYRNRANWDGYQYECTPCRSVRDGRRRRTAAA